MKKNMYKIMNKEKENSYYKYGRKIHERGLKRGKKSI